MHDHVVTGDRRIVEAWSRSRLPFEPRGSALDLRAEIRSGVAALEPGGVLHCTYGSANRRPCDVENVLLYNVGMSAFRPLTGDGIVFERSYDVPAHPTGATFAHHYRYVVGAPIIFEHWKESTVVARWRAEAPRHGADKPAGWWAGAIAGVSCENDALGDVAVFGLRIRVGTGRVSIASSLKPMLDGFIAALHHDPDPSPLAVERLAAHLNLSSPAVNEMLLGEGHSPLGARTIVRPYRENVQWNPADDRCVACAVLMDDQLEPSMIEGELLAVHLGRP